MNKKMQELQIAQQVAEGQSQRLAAENDALNKDVGRLRHLEQTRSTPTWMTTVASSPVPQAMVTPVPPYQSPRPQRCC